MTDKTLADFTEKECECIVEQLGVGGVASLAALTTAEQVAECERILDELEDSP